MTIDMSAAVTRAELREELASYPTKADLREELERFATKKDLELWGGALLDRIERGDAALRAEMGNLRTELRDEMAEQRTEMKRLLQAGIEQFQRSLRVFDDPYRDLPERVTRLEAKVFPPKRTRRRSG